MADPQIHHVGYVVDDLQSAAEHFSAAYGAGPFFGIEHLEFDYVDYLGEPAVYDHSSAFGQFGSVIVELTKVYDAAPAGLRAALAEPGSGVGHIAWLADSLDDESERLQAAGHGRFHSGRAGPVSAAWFEGGAQIGHPIEVLQRCDELDQFYEMVASASKAWDGSEPLRILAPPTA